MYILARYFNYSFLTIWITLIISCRSTTGSIYLSILVALCETFLTISIGQTELANYSTAHPELGCTRILHRAAWLETLAMITHSSLFLIRVLAVYARSSWKVKLCFLAAWSSTLLSLLIPFSIVEKRRNWSSVPSCKVSMRLWALSGFVTTATFDTLVFFSISYKVLRNNRGAQANKESWPAALIRPRGLLHVSETLLRSGQFYYLCVPPCSCAIETSTDLCHFPTF